MLHLGKEYVEKRDERTRLMPHVGKECVHAMQIGKIQSYSRVGVSVSGSQEREPTAGS
jgi:hypothetical protein